ncbi:MAG: amidophosphoribosyltransferase [Candidatus Doudnabacteria bacterium RIFCSPHIGHO2_01_52_17]|uniref:Amidophosphoribosyltransferase n=1 Tax=Candidatus Doudnabacteria bacterium RIFCSPHIGHO2_01_52_17 TaxID=1817820 RepID=A0A1F5NAN6_9BACT|nr:MAG: Amidophosphoribosyltransferase [Parcubacteria group bacterium GW2011_GWA2_52_8]OGE74644.1 MAG: amidophosphoribosyltransferase [Candidatus Doudnabacteria bacterium RIFCSPHIGHO2_01_52_17]
MCGIVGVFNNTEAANFAYLGLYALQHRGQESASIVSVEHNGTSNLRAFHAEKGMGLVAQVFKPEVLARLPGNAAIGHTRYSTTGDSNLLNAQPLLAETNKGRFALAHNGNLVNAEGWRKELEWRGSIFQTTTDTEVINHLIALSRKGNFTEALIDALRQIEGAYSIVLLTQSEFFAARDPRGFRPLVLGQAGESWIVASETCAFDLIGATYVREIEPGEIVRISQNGLESVKFAQAVKQQCIFEHVYFSRPDSVVFGRSVYRTREQLGRLLAQQHPTPEAEIVVPVPDSGVPAAIGYAMESGTPFRMGLIRNHYVGRTFIEPKQSIRDFGTKLKLNPVRELLRDKSVVLVDDSIVRGTTSKKIVRMVWEAGAREVHMRISCPPTIKSCQYGIDTPTSEELIAAHRSEEEIRAFIGADSLHYLSLVNLRSAVQPGEHGFCDECYSGRSSLVRIEG